MSTHSDDECTSLGFAVLNDFSERMLRKASIKGSTSPSAPRARQDDLDVRMEVLLQSPTTDPNQLSTINTWLLNGLKARQKGGQAESRSDDRLVYELSIPRHVADDPASWKQLGSEAPETVRSGRVEFTGPVRRSEPEGAGFLVSRQIEELVKSLNNTEQLNDNLTRNGRYSKVSVLPIMFETVEPKLELEDDLNGLKECFVEHFNFHVYEIFKIPETTNAQYKLEKKIEELIHAHGKKDELVIVVYAGHGLNPEAIEREKRDMGPSIWIPCATSKQGEGVSWSHIQPSLHSAPCDTLIILNCCFKANAVLGGMKGTNEILAASDRQSYAYTREGSFLRALIEVLAKLKDTRSSLTINMLRDRLDDYNKIDREKGTRIASPYHKRYPNLDHPSIKLQALPNSNTPVERPTASTQIPYPASFYVKVSLDSPGNASLDEWTSCFASANYPNAIKELYFYTEQSLRNGLMAEDGK